MTQMDALQAATIRPQSEDRSPQRGCRRGLTASYRSEGSAAMLRLLTMQAPKMNSRNALDRGRSAIIRAAETSVLGMEDLHYWLYSSTAWPARQADRTWRRNDGERYSRKQGERKRRRIVSFTNIQDVHVIQACRCFVDCHQIGSHLGRMFVLTHRIDHRHATLIGILFHFRQGFGHQMVQRFWSKVS